MNLLTGHKLETALVSAEEKERKAEAGKNDRCRIGFPGYGSELEGVLFCCSHSSWHHVFGCRDLTTLDITHLEICKHGQIGENECSCSS